ncbi:MAG: hypothetical protein IJY47_04900 [Clostridia bacterium]|nr:hypothetical protein [Clostridia bacterium]
MGVVAKTTPDMLEKEEETTVENEESATSTEDWVLLERVEGCGVSISEETCARVAEGGKFKVIAFACSSENDMCLTVNGTATLNHADGTSESVTFFELNSDVVGEPHEAIFEVNPAEGESYSNILIGGGMKDSIELYVFVVE